MTSSDVRLRLIWCSFAILLALATAPAWRVIAFGVSPTLDQALLLICSGGVRP
jgi:hypothetical protein